MKTFLMLFALLYGALFVRAELLWVEVPGELPYAEHNPSIKIPEIKLIDGRQFLNCEVFKETYATISFRHAKGISKVEKARLPPDLLKLFPLNTEAAKVEAETNAAGHKVYADTIKRQETRVEQKSERVNKTIPAARPSPTTSSRPVSMPDITAAVRREAEHYYSDGHKNGSGYTLVFGLSIDLDEPRAVPGWTNRYEVKGMARYNYYESIKGGAFSSSKGSFIAQVEQTPTGGLTVVDFSPGF